jgi:CRISPR-associated endonuclease Csn1
VTHSGKSQGPYRLGIDVGSNSVGWFVVWLNEDGEPFKLGPGGVRIFPDGRDPQSKTSNAVSRRVARGARRRRDRYLARRSRLMELLVEHGLMPSEETDRKSLEALDPFELRAAALDQKLPVHHVGRALFHMNQRRGFLSNRKTEKGDNEAGAIKEASRRLDEMLAKSGARTLGEFLCWRHKERAPVRARSHSSTPRKAEYDFYPTRGLLEAEFEAIWEAQSAHHPREMSNEARSALHHAIFFQRPLKVQPVGKCSLDPAREKNDAEGFRCLWSHPLAQRFRIWQEVRNLAISETGQQSRTLTKEEGDKVALALVQNGTVSFSKMRTLLNLSADSRFNLESEKRTKLNGDQTAAKLANKNFFGKPWRGIPLERQIEIVHQLSEVEAENEIVAWLTSEAGLDPEAALRTASALLPDGHCRLGLRAIGKILPHMESGMNYPDAAKAAGYDHSLQPTGELSQNGRLPYYGEWLKDEVVGSGERNDPKEVRWGRFPNPTVHIGLGQIRRVVNSLIAELGAPEQIVIEMARDFKLSPKQRAELEREQADNQRKNDERAEQLKAHNHRVNHRNLLKMRLWEELNLSDPLDRRCPYTGEQIGITKLLSEEVDIDHLIPFQDSWDDSAANKTVCMSRANREKGKRTPFEAFGSTPEWPDISQRAGSLPRGKRWRFAPDARERFKEQGGFLARQLNETGWLARLTKKYLTAVSDPYSIWVLPGKMTAMLRGKWGLNELLPDHNYGDAKNRKDHRHHAIDALVAALTDRSLLQRISRAYDEERQKIGVPFPWDTLREELKASLDVMTVSHKPDHGARGRLHEDTAYGVVDDASSKENLVYRKTFVDLNANEIDRIRDARLRDLVSAHLASEEAKGRDLTSALKSFAEKTDIPGLPNGIRHVRILKSEKPEYLVPIRTSDGTAYKAYSAGENAFVDIYETGDGKWSGEAVSLFQANQLGHRPHWMDISPTPKFVMRVHKGDTISLDGDAGRVVMQVYQLEAAAGRFKLAPHNEAGNFTERHKVDNEIDPFRWLMASYNTLRRRNAQRVRVDTLGRVWRIKPEEASRTLGT